MSDAQRVIDDIDALVDEQMAGGEAETGYSRCRCGGMWHGLRKGGCPGSDSEGPLVGTGLTFGSCQDLRQDMEPFVSAFRGIAGCQAGTSSTATGGEVRPPGGARRPCDPHVDP